MHSEQVSSTPPDRAPRHFPPGFRFGVATSAHQVEGNNVHSDWWEFEQRPGAIADSSRSGAACEHYIRYHSDLDLIKSLALDSYRFSIEWARVEPKPGRFDHIVLDHYGEVIEACRQRGLEPFVTLHHFTLPRWFSDAGGWELADSPALFARYVRYVCQALRGQVTWWMTMNEPAVLLVQAYTLGVWPPRYRHFGRMVRAGRNMIRAHFLAARAIKETQAAASSGPQVTVAKHLRVFDPYRPGNRLDTWAAALQENSFNWAFADSLQTRRYQPPLGMRDRVKEDGPGEDVAGINYYSRDRVRFHPFRPGEMFGERRTTPGAALTDLGWEIYPEGLARVVRADFGRYGKPIFISENGIADAADAQRPAFLVQHLAQVGRLLQEGVPLQGYFHWSLLDNFEWSEGFRPRFGLVEVDYRTQERRPRPSAHLYARIAAARRLPAE
jgi:beta-glucosidase